MYLPLFHLKGLLPFLLLCLLPLQKGHAQASCGTDGSIKTGSSIILDPNSDGYFSVYSSSGFTVANNEYTEFEVLTGAGGADKGWTRLTGSDPNDDLLSGSGCGNTDIVTDGDGGSDYAYYSIVDPDGTADSGDEYLAFALRIADKTNGAFGFSFLIDSDNNCASGDGNSVCGNPCFEYEVQLSTSNSGGDVEVYDVDGCYGTSDCNTLHGAGVNICGGVCNSEGLQVCAGGTACSTGDPVFWVFYVEFSDLPGLNSTDPFSITPASNTSGNQIIYKSANVSDYGGVDDINDVNGTCDCTSECSGNPCSKCQQDCLLSCAADQNGLNVPLPVSWISFSAEKHSAGVALTWETQEYGDFLGYTVERNTGDGFEEIKWLSSSGDQTVSTYRFIDQPTQQGRILYRLKSLDVGGMFQYSSVKEVWIEERTYVYYDEATESFFVAGSATEHVVIEILDLQGRVIESNIKLDSGRSYSVERSGIPSGIYVLRYLLKGKPYLQKVRIL